MKDYTHVTAFSLSMTALKCEEYIKLLTLSLISENIRCDKVKMTCTYRILKKYNQQ